MSNLRDIRRRIKSVKNTSQITKAMQLVAAAKMRKAQEQALVGRDYLTQLEEVIKNLRENLEEFNHPLLEQQKHTGKRLVLLISTDKGLCGGLNAQLLKKLLSFEGDTPTDYVTVGRKLSLSLGKLNKPLLADWHIEDPVPFAKTQPITTFLTSSFLEKHYDAVYIAYSYFINTLSQEARIERLLPILDDAQKKEPISSPTTFNKDYLFEPSEQSVLNTLLPLALNQSVYQRIVEARASEHSARMVSMKAATDNAKQMIDALTLDYNKARQAAITSELLEITTAQKAMN